MSYRNAPISPVLRLIYLFLRITSWLGVTFFYRRRIVLGREHLQFDGPAIIVVNHPSTLMDVLNPCVHIRQEPFFLANYGLFKHPVSNWILTRLFSIPVKRREDVAEGEARNNDAAFEKSFQHLEKNGILFIAAEGVSWMERWVRPFKTGAARIAFGAENRQNWELGVKILPVGVSYTAPNLFRSEVIVHFGAPVEAAPWKAAEARNHEQAVEDFTTTLNQHVRNLVLDTRDQEGQTFIEQLEKVKRPQFPKDDAGHFEFRKQLIAKSIDNQELKAQTAQYFQALAEVKITEEGMQQALYGKPILDALLLILGFPFFLTGYVFWFLPCYLPWLLTRKMNLYIGYDSNVKMLSGLFTFSFALYGAYKVALHFTGNGWWGIATMLGLLVLGYFAEQWMDAAKRLRLRMATNRFKKSNPAAFEALTFQHNAIAQS